MTIEIPFSGKGGNVDHENFYVDQNNNFYYDALYGKTFDEAGGNWANAGPILEVTDWNTGKQLFGPAIQGLEFNISNYRPPVAGSVNLSGQLNPSDLFNLKQNAAPQDPEPLDIAAMNLAAEKQAAALAKSNNAAEQVQAAQDARVENANTVTPEPTEQQVGTDGRVVTNAIKQPLNNNLYTEDFGDDGASTNAGVVETQPTLPTGTATPGSDIPVGGDEYAIVGTEETDGGAIPEDGTQTLIPSKDIGESGTETGTQVGVTTAGDADSGGSASPLPKQFLSKIETKSNPLNGLSSYTYSVSLYLINKTGLQRLQQGIKSVAGLPLILQSGGAQSVGADMYGAKRSSFFRNDYYIDDIELDGIVTGTSTQSIHNQHTIRFSITEPYGLTFIDNLHNAVKEYKTSLGFAAEKINYSSQMYLMVIRFYGYDAEGVPKSLSQIEDSGFSEKYIPFIFTGVRFRMEDNKIVYNCEAAAPMSFYNLNATHAALPFNIELNGGTIGDVLGDPAGSTYNAENFDQRDDAGAIKADTSVTLHTGLVQALNKESEKAYGKEFANVYKIVFEEGAEFESKKIVPPGSTNKSRTAMKPSAQQPQNPTTDKANKEQRTKTLQAGTSIVQAIEYIVRNSEYITAQQNLEIDERTGKPKRKDTTVTEPLQWFKVVMQTTPRSDKVNPITNDYAYEIVYKVKRYAIGNSGSPYFAPPVFRGVHKRYPYWFTGENTEVLNFQQDFNYMYFQQFGNGATPDTMPQINTVHVARRYYMPRSNENVDGNNSIGEPSASAASLLYSPGDLATSSIDIVGDPDWIAQSEIFYGVDKANNNPFEEDGSVNYNASEVYYSVEWNLPNDYDIETGLMDVKRDTQDASKPKISLAYRANRIVSKLSGGKFSQTLQGTLMQWVDSENVTRVDQGFVYDPQKRATDIAASLEDSDNKLFAAEDAVDRFGASSSSSQYAQMLAEQNIDGEIENDDDSYWDDVRQPTESADDFPDIFDQGDADALETWDNVSWGDEEDTPTSTQPPLTSVKPNSTSSAEVLKATNPNTMTQNTITKTGGDKTVEQTPAFQEFPTPQPETTTDPADPYAQFANGIPYTRDVNDALLPKGYVYIAKDASGELVQFEVTGNGDAKSIMAQDPETGEWYKL